MRAKRVLRYYAECGKGFWKKQSAIDHEGNCMCWKNPKNRACTTCRYGDYFHGCHETGEAPFWQCDHPTRNEIHSGAPKGLDFISVNCTDYGRVDP